MPLCAKLGLQAVQPAEAVTQSGGEGLLTTLKGAWPCPSAPLAIAVPFLMSTRAASAAKTTSRFTRRSRTLRVIHYNRSRREFEAGNLPVPTRGHMPR
jgi:hypothetical protein